MSENFSPEIAPKSEPKNVTTRSKRKANAQPGPSMPKPATSHKSKICKYENKGAMRFLDLMLEGCLNIFPDRGVWYLGGGVLLERGGSHILPLIFKILAFFSDFLNNFRLRRAFSLKFL